MEENAQTVVDDTVDRTASEPCGSRNSFIQVQLSGLFLCGVYVWNPEKTYGYIPVPIFGKSNFLNLQIKDCKKIGGKPPCQTRIRLYDSDPPDPDS